MELQDQIEVLQWLAGTTNCIDVNRVAIHGWSYGGYLTLLGLAQYPNIFKVCTEMICTFTGTVIINIHN